MSRSELAQERYMYASYDTESSNLKHFGLLYQWGKSYTPMPHDAAWYQSHMVESTDEIAYLEGRNADELQEDLMYTLKESVESNIKWRCSFHNLPHDWSFIHLIIKDIDTYLEMLGCVFVDGERRPEYFRNAFCKNSTSLTSLTVSRWTYDKKRGWRPEPVWSLFDTLALSGLPVRDMASSVAHKLETDYSLIRTPATELDDGEEQYQRADTDTVFSWVLNDLCKRPGVSIRQLGFRAKTKTGLVRLGDKTRFLQRTRPKRAEEEYQTTYNDDSCNFLLCNFSNGGFYGGGVNFSNYNYNGVICSDVDSYDFASSYPARMWQNDVPIEPHMLESIPPEYLEPVAYEPSIQAQVPFWTGTVVFHGLRVRQVWWDSVGSTSITKSMLVSPNKPSGGIWSHACLWEGESVEMRVTMTTYAEMCLQYQWDSVESAGPCCVWCGYAPPSLYTLTRMHFHYGEKAYAKAVKKGLETITLEEAEKIGYIGESERNVLEAGTDEGWIARFALRHKADLNSLYGIMVTDETKTRYTLDEAGDIVPDTRDDKGKDKKQLIRVQGVYIAEMSRYALVWCAAQVAAAGGIVLHGDTDSLKVINIDRPGVEAAVREYTESCARLTASRLAEFEALYTDVNGQRPPEVDLSGLGAFDYEGRYDKFCTFGKKKYAVLKDGKFCPTCSGYSLKAVREFYEYAAPIMGPDWAMLAAMGWGNTYDESTGIATEYYVIDREYVYVTIDDHLGKHWEGVVSPGRGIRSRAKVMNDPEQQVDTAQRWAAAMSRPLCASASHLVIHKDGDRWLWHDSLERGLFDDLL